MNVKKTIAVGDATYAVGERKPNNLLYIHSFIPQFTLTSYYRVSQKFVPLLYNYVFQYDWTW